MKKKRVFIITLKIIVFSSILLVSCATPIPSYKKGVDDNKRFLLNHTENETLVLFFINNLAPNMDFYYCIVTNESDQQGVVGELLLSSVNNNNNWVERLNPVILRYSNGNGKTVAGFRLPKDIKKITLILDYGNKEGQGVNRTTKILELNEKPEQYYIVRLNEENTPIIDELSEGQMKVMLRYINSYALHFNENNPKKQVGHITP